MPRIIRNAIRCKKCGDIIESKTVHDFKFCSCGSCAVDGGHDYLRRCGNREDWEELSEAEKVENNGALTLACLAEIGGAGILLIIICNVTTNCPGQPRHKKEPLSMDANRSKNVLRGIANLGARATSTHIPNSG